MNNSTILLWILTQMDGTSNATDWITELTAYATVAMVIANAALVIVTCLNLSVVKKQSKTMRDQTHILYKDMEKEHLVRKHERLVKEMERLVSPLNASIRQKADRYFGYAVKPATETHSEHSYYFTFWQDIKQNAYLAPKELRDALRDYLTADDNYWKNFGGPQLSEFKELKETSKNELFNKIEIRFESLNQEIEDIECELENTAS